MPHDAFTNSDMRNFIEDCQLLGAEADLYLD